MQKKKSSIMSDGKYRRRSEKRFRKRRCYNPLIIIKQEATDHEKRRREAMVLRISSGQGPKECEPAVGKHTVGV